MRGCHGGILAASFVLVVEILENLAFLANASNLVLHLSKYMNLTPAKSADTVTNCMGTAFLLVLLRGFLSDAFFTAYRIYLMSAVIKFLVRIVNNFSSSTSVCYFSDHRRSNLTDDEKESKAEQMARGDQGIENELHMNGEDHTTGGDQAEGLLMLTLQARLPSLKPATCNPGTASSMCKDVSGGKAAFLYFGLYLIALGVGGIKRSLPAHGAEQFNEETLQGKKQRSTFFNYFCILPLCWGSSNCSDICGMD
ncbi:hypothetical protein GIB67_009292 [Kingdonia uniflora]|uniref:Uncharacterized protein n=1 Tax=Kingdonia uniflora TaxID=39325 RepID=A0A7J7N2Q3_9MAGN|nr:hypothetical protein GIB67_009292 [Kingdonia uniflora]